MNCSDLKLIIYFFSPCKRSRIQNKTTTTKIVIMKSCISPVTTSYILSRNAITNQIHGIKISHMK